MERKVIPHPTSESRHSTSDRCYPLLFQKIKSNIANEINWLMKADSIFPCIYSEFSESSPASISVDRFCIERKVGADLRKLMAAEGSFGHVEALHAGISELKDGLCDLTRKQLDIATR
ncbi:MAG TPA: hypothetical protein VEF34_04615 [Syntrophobacteraceae bacterium]|nr:hypothetical protein [Syntrophobacteraceae bacterium]